MRSALLRRWVAANAPRKRSEEHTSELQSHLNLVCRLLLEKKKNTAVHQAHTNLARRGELEGKNHDMCRRHANQPPSDRRYLPTWTVDVQHASHPVSATCA